MKTSEPYVLNTVPNLRLPKLVYFAVRQGATTKAELKEQTLIAEDTLETAIDGLNLFGLVGRRQERYEPETPPIEVDDPDLTFRLAVLNSVATEADPSDWGKQSALLLNLEYLLAEDIQQFKQSESSLINRIDRWHQQRGYNPKTSQGRSDLNPEKFSFWTNMAEDLGLLYRSQNRPAEYIVRFDPELVAASITLACDAVGTDQTVTIESYLTWLESNLLRIPRTTDKAIPKSFARTLYELAASNHIQLIKRGDPNPIRLSGVPTHEHLDSNANAIRVI